MNATSDPFELLREDRLTSLQRTRLLDAPPEVYFDRITRMVSRLVKSDTALLSLVGADRQFFTSQCGLPEPYATARQTPLSHSFCKYVVMSNKPFIVRDARVDPLLVNNGAVLEIGVVSYLGVPVHDRQGRVLGSLCAIGGEPRDWSSDDLAVMQDLAGVVEDELALRQHARRSIALAEENAVLAREYHHRVKNALAVSAALVKLSSREATSIEELVDASAARLTALANAHDALLADSDHVGLHDLTHRLLAPYRVREASAATIEGPDITLRHDQVTPICLFLHELATNSAKYGAIGEGSGVTVRWEQTAAVVVLVWLEATDGASHGPEGFGSKLLDVAARQLQGSCRVERTARALTASLQFPLERDSDEL